MQESHARLVSARNFTAATALALLLGCATTTTWDDIDAGLTTLLGSHIDVAIKRIGSWPDSEQEVAGRKVYTWSTRKTDPGYSLPKITSGTVGGEWVSLTETNAHQIPSSEIG